MADKISAAELKCCLKVAECDSSLVFFLVGCLTIVKLPTVLNWAEAKRRFFFFFSCFRFAVGRKHNFAKLQAVGCFMPFWFEEKNDVKVNYLTLVFGRTSSTELTKKMLSLLDDKIFKKHALGPFLQHIS